MANHSGRRSEEHTSELQSQSNLVCRLLLEKQEPSYRACVEKVHEPRLAAIASSSAKASAFGRVRKNFPTCLQKSLRSTSLPQSSQSCRIDRPTGSSSTR